MKDRSSSTLNNFNPSNASASRNGPDTLNNPNLNHLTSRFITTLPWRGLTRQGLKL